MVFDMSDSRRVEVHGTKFAQVRFSFVWKRVPPPLGGCVLPPSPFRVCVRPIVKVCVSSLLMGVRALSSLLEVSSSSVWVCELPPLLFWSLLGWTRVSRSLYGCFPSLFLDMCLLIYECSISSLCGYVFVSVVLVPLLSSPLGCSSSPPSLIPSHRWRLVSF